MSLSRPTRRKFLGMTAALGASVPILSSCAGGGSTSSNRSDMAQVDFEAPGEFSDREHNIVIWSAFGGHNGETMDRLIRTFNESQDDIYAEVQFQGPYEESGPKLRAAMQANAVPDIAVLADTWWGRFLLSDRLEPLDDYFDDTFNKDIYLDSLINEGVADDKLYWVSLARSTPLFYYNRDMFEQLGLPDRGPESWTELREWSDEIVKLKAHDQPVKAHAFKAGDDWMFMAAAWQFGGRFSEGLEVTIDQGGAIDAGEWQQHFIFQDEKAYMTSAPPTDFANGVAATIVDSTGILRSVYENAEFNVGASALPAEVTNGVPTGGAGLVVPRGIPEERRAAAMEVIKYLATPEVSADWTLSTGYLPIVKEAVNEPDLAAKIAEDPNYSAAIDQLPIAEPTDAIRQFLPNATELIIGGMQRIFSSRDEDVEAAFGDVAARLREGVEEIQESYDSYFG